MDALVLPLFRESPARTSPVAPSAPGFLAPPPDAAPVAEVRIRFVSRSSSARGPLRGSGDLVRRAVQALAAAGATRISTSGSARDPIVEARLAGAGCANLAAETAEAIIKAGRRPGVVPAAAVAHGFEAITDSGVRLLVGDPSEVADRLCDRAAPGQVLLGGNEWTQLGGVEMFPSRPGGPATRRDQVPVFVLRDVR